MGPVLAAKIGPGGPFLAADRFFRYRRINFNSLILRLLSCKFAMQIFHLHDYVPRGPTSLA